MKAKIMNVVTKLMSSVAAMVLVTAVANANFQESALSDHGAVHTYGSKV